MNDKKCIKCNKTISIQELNKNDGYCKECNAKIAQEIINNSSYPQYAIDELIKEKETIKK
jgi:hypothetical protein